MECSCDRRKVRPLPQHQQTPASCAKPQPQAPVQAPSSAEHCDSSPSSSGSSGSQGAEPEPLLIGEYGHLGSLIFSGLIL